MKRKHPTPEHGLVIRYDFLFPEEHAQGRDSGKDRPCVIVLAVRKNATGSQTILVAPITHTPPQDSKDAIEIPLKLCNHLGLDSNKMWVKTDALNSFLWEDNRVPFGITLNAEKEWTYGFIPPKFYDKIIESVQQHANTQTLNSIPRE